MNKKLTSVKRRNKKNRKSSIKSRRIKSGNERRSRFALAAAVVFTLAAFLAAGSSLFMNRDKAYGTASKGKNVQAATGASIERRAVWISFIDFGENGKYKKKTKNQFVKSVRRKFRKCRNMNMTDVVVHVRPSGDAFYPSKYFPWSKYISGKQGKGLNYDPLDIMVREAHRQGLMIEAWINPYRISLNSTRIHSLSRNNPARRWYSRKKTRHNVLKWGTQLYYNPSSPEVRNLVINGVREIVRNYDVDGIHMDDYFYPSLGSSYRTAFDAPQYNSYVKKCKSSGSRAMSIVSWRRNNVNLLVRGIYKAVKTVKPECEFGISPAGNIDNLMSSTMYYTDIYKWCSRSGYIDYIAPQIYWDFDYGKASYHKVLRRWNKVAAGGPVRLYAGLAVSNTVPPLKGQWRNKNIIRRQVLYTRSHSKVCRGFYFFSYSALAENKYNKAEISRLESVLKKQK